MSSHENDVIFNEDGLEKLITLIKTNPDMIKNLSTPDNVLEDIERIVYGKQTIVQRADGTIEYVVTGNDISIPNFETILNNDNIDNGTITIGINNSQITIPLKGIVKDFDGTFANINDGDDMLIPSRDAVKKCMALKPLKIFKTASTEDWNPKTENTPPYFQDIIIEEVFEEDNPSGIDVVMSGVYEIDKKRDKEWGKIYRVETSDGKITLYAHSKPVENLPFRMDIIR